MEQIKRANRLYTNDSIFLKESLFIPVMTESLSFTNGVNLIEEETSSGQTHFEVQTHTCQTDCSRLDENADLSPVEYLKKIDSLISQSKQAAMKTCQEGEKQFSFMEEQPYYSKPASSPASFQQPVLGAIPITITKRSRNLRDREDEIFQLWSRLFMDTALCFWNILEGFHYWFHPLKCQQFATLCETLVSAVI